MGQEYEHRHTFCNTFQLFRTVGHDPHLQPNLPSAFFAMLTTLSAERMESCMTWRVTVISQDTILRAMAYRKQIELETTMLGPQKPGEQERTAENKLVLFDVTEALPAKYGSRLQWCLRSVFSESPCLLIPTSIIYPVVNNTFRGDHRDACIVLSYFDRDMADELW